MGWRFRKSVKLLPGVRVNFGLRGASLSLGPRGASVSLSSRGVYSNLSLPGTGLSYRERLDKPARRPAVNETSAPRSVEVKLTVTLEDDGMLSVRLPDGTAAPASVVAELKRKEGVRLLEFLDAKAQALGQALKALEQVHLGTRAPDAPLAAYPGFDEPEPKAPTQKEPSFLEDWLPGFAQRQEAERAQTLEAWRLAHAAWTMRRIEHEQRHAQALQAFAEALQSDAAWRERHLEERLGSVDWPRPTHVSYAVQMPEARLWLDIDLPEFEDLQASHVQVRPRQWRLAFKSLSATEARELYARLVHGIVFRAVGEAFAALPCVREVVASGYSQRVQPATGRINDEYLLSVRMPRTEWGRLDFTALERVDVLQALQLGELRRRMDARHHLSGIEPHEPPASLGPLGSG